MMDLVVNMFLWILAALITSLFLVSFIIRVSVFFTRNFRNSKASNKEELDPTQDSGHDQHDDDDNDDNDDKIDAAYKCVLTAKMLESNYIDVRWPKDNQDDITIMALTRVIDYYDHWDVESLFGDQRIRHHRKKGRRNESLDLKSQYLLYLHPLIFCWYGESKRVRSESEGELQVAVVSSDYSSSNKLVSRKTQKILQAFSGKKELTWLHVQNLDDSSDHRPYANDHPEQNLNELTEEVLSDFLETFLSRYKKERAKLRKNKKGTQVELGTLKKHLSATDVLDCPRCGHSHPFKQGAETKPEVIQCLRCDEELVYTSSTLTSLMSPPPPPTSSSMTLLEMGSGKDSDDQKAQAQEQTAKRVVSK